MSPSTDAKGKGKAKRPREDSSPISQKDAGDSPSGRQARPSVSTGPPTFAHRPLDPYDKTAFARSREERSSIQGTPEDKFAASGLLFRDLEEGLAHISRRKWKPLCGDQDVPKTNEAMWPWVKSLALAFRDLTKVRDHFYPDKLAFRAENKEGTIWTDKEIEAVAHLVVYETVKLHLHGCSSMRYRDPDAFQKVQGHERDWPFTRRMNLIKEAILHYKRIAHRTMKGIGLDELIATPCMLADHMDRTHMRDYQNAQMQMAMAGGQLPHGPMLPQPQPDPQVGPQAGRGRSGHQAGGQPPAGRGRGGHPGGQAQAGRGRGGQPGGGQGQGNQAQ